MLLRAKGAEGRDLFPGLRVSSISLALPGLGVAEVRVPDGPLCPLVARESASGQGGLHLWVMVSGASFLGKGSSDLLILYGTAAAQSPV